MACCKCGGGLTSATPFRYYTEPLLSGSGTVKGYPLPRAGSSYSVDDKCQLLKYNLTIDGLTGALKLVDGCRTVGCGHALQQNFAVKCTITAHEGEFNASATLSVTGSLLAYKSSVLVVPPMGRDFAAQNSTRLSSPRVQCVPDTLGKVLDIAESFELRVKAGASQALQGAGVTALTLPGLPAAPGGLCKARPGLLGEPLERGSWIRLEQSCLEKLEFPALCRNRSPGSTNMRR
ncbi:unnamed protein product [Symbiodinium natans]|uniref:Uncharacterized protein n=1 Tax=Symbiodinium natans TaxID=878477 RepID=A0A812R3Q1_9DINO|nr:unnamed protein product [Symbiodinium natans]